jgi:hypothetical protein
MRYQRQPSAIAVHGDLKATAQNVLGVEDGTVSAVDLRNPDPVLAGLWGVKTVSWALTWPFTLLVRIR